MVVLHFFAALLWIVLLASYVIFAVVAARDINSD